MNLNVVVLTGNLTSAPESFADGRGANFGLAVNGREKQGEEWIDRADFFQVTCFGKTAENVLKFLAKGSPVAVDGRLRQDRWEKDGQKRNAVKVIADRVQFLGSKDDSGGGNSGPSDAGPPSDPDSDIPF